MPLCTVVERDGKDISKEYSPWDERMLFCWLTASIDESMPGKLDEITGGRYSNLGQFDRDGQGYDRMVDLSTYCFMGGPYLDPWGDALKIGRQTLKRDWKFFILGTGPEGEDSRIIEFKQGDVLRAWRET